MLARKIYLQPSRVVYKGMLDLMDSQRGKKISCDCERLSLRFHVLMFDEEWGLRFTVRTIDRNRCEAVLEVKETGEWESCGELRALADCLLRREYAMLDAMLLIGTPFETSCGEAGDTT